MQYSRQKVCSRHIGLFRITGGPERFIAKFIDQLFDCAFDYFVALHIHLRGMSPNLELCLRKMSFRYELLTRYVSNRNATSVEFLTKTT